MPQPIRKVGIGYRAYPKFALDRPRLAALIGAIAAEWSVIDGTLAAIFATISGGTRVIPVGVMAIDELARESFSDITALELRLKILQKALKKVALASKGKAFIALAGTLRSRTRERTTVIHGNWRVADEYPNDLMLLKADGSAHRYTEKDFQNILGRIAKIGAELRRFQITLSNSLLKQNHSLLSPKGS